MQYRPNEIFVGDDNKNDDIVYIVDKRKYEQAVSECKKLRTFIKAVIRRNTTLL